MPDLPPCSSRARAKCILHPNRLYQISLLHRDPSYICPPHPIVVLGCQTPSPIMISTHPNGQQSPRLNEQSQNSLQTISGPSLNFAVVPPSPQSARGWACNLHPPDKEASKTMRLPQATRRDRMNGEPQLQNKGMMPPDTERYKGQNFLVQES